jgi:hypothetical protein
MGPKTISKNVIMDGWDNNGVIKETHYTVMGYNGRMWESQ